jgi:transcriptional regulator
MLKIRDLTVPEINKCIELCNFTDDELQLFKLKAKDKSTVQIRHEMHISESQVSALSRRVRTKIKKIL